MVNIGVHDSVGGVLKGSPKHKRTMPTVSFSLFFVASNFWRNRGLIEQTRSIKWRISVPDVGERDSVVVAQRSEMSLFLLECFFCVCVPFPLSFRLPAV